MYAKSNNQIDESAIKLAKSENEELKKSIDKKRKALKDGKIVRK